MRLRAERRVRQLLIEERMAQPDTVQCGEDCIRLHWNGKNTSIIVEFDEDGEIGVTRVGPPPAGGQTAEAPV